MQRQGTDHCGPACVAFIEATVRSRPARSALSVRLSAFRKLPKLRYGFSPAQVCVALRRIDLAYVHRALPDALPPDVPDLAIVLFECWPEGKEKWSHYIVRSRSEWMDPLTGKFLEDLPGGVRATTLITPAREARRSARSFRA